MMDFLMNTNWDYVLDAGCRFILGIIGVAGILYASYLEDNCVTRIRDDETIK